MKRLIRQMAVLGAVAGCILFLGNAWAMEMEVIDINAATVEELETLPGMDSVVANDIVSFRTMNGPFTRVDDLLKVRGMSIEKLDVIREFITIEMAPNPVEQPDLLTE
ncbi:MAG: helix-hairpin-helix domain-containing protein [Deltaproteobacteria bacterium]|nr:helix-hairpin-helix domain-containing protein [Deltaproteobacteria bacterium]